MSHIFYSELLSETYVALRAGDETRRVSSRSTIGTAVRYW